MNDQDYILKAVELADGWRYWGNDYFVVKGVFIHAPTWVIKDALAAQLVRQVDNLGTVDIQIFGRGTEINQSGHESTVRIASDRTMNTIRAIVDSEVLT